MKLTNKQKLAQYWNHNINPITGFKEDSRSDKLVVERKENALIAIHRGKNK